MFLRLFLLWSPCGLRCLRGDFKKLRQEFPLLQVGVVDNHSIYSGPMTKTMNDGSKATIIRIISANAVDVQFEDGFVLKHARLTQFNKGTLKGHHTNTNV